MADFDFLLSYLPTESLDVRSASSPRDLDLAHPTRQILMIASGWSGYSVIRLQLLARHLPAVVGRDVPIVVVNHDAIPSISFRRDGERFFGSKMGDRSGY